MSMSIAADFLNPQQSGNRIVSNSHLALFPQFACISSVALLSFIWHQYLSQINTMALGRPSPTPSSLSLETPAKPPTLRTTVFLSCKPTPSLRTPTLS